MRRLAADLDVEAMSLYYYLPAKEALLDGVAEAVSAEITAASDHVDTQDGWRVRSRQRFLAARQVMLRHPWAPGLLHSRTTVPAGMYAYYDGIAGTLIGAGFSYHLAHRALHALGSLPLGFAQEVFSPASAGGSIEVDTAETDMSAMAATLPHLAAMAAAELHDVTDPALRRARTPPRPATERVNPGDRHAASRSTGKAHANSATCRSPHDDAYDRAEQSLDRHQNHILATYVATRCQACAHNSVVGERRLMPLIGRWTSATSLLDPNLSRFFTDTE